MVNSNLSNVWPRIVTYIDGVYIFDVMLSSDNSVTVIGQISFCPESALYSWIKKAYGVDGDALCQKIDIAIKNIHYMRQKKNEGYGIK